MLLECVPQRCTGRNANGMAGVKRYCCCLGLCHSAIGDGWMAFL